MCACEGAHTTRPDCALWAPRRLTGRLAARSTLLRSRPLSRLRASRSESPSRAEMFHVRFQIPQPFPSRFHMTRETEFAPRLPILHPYPRFIYTVPPLAPQHRTCA
eukprot:1216657-Prymnesium_polylepis.3